MGKDTVKVGLLGAGTIGGGVIDLYKSNSNLLNERVGFAVVFEKVADLDQERLQALGLTKEQISTDAADVLENPDLDIVIELIGGIKPAYGFIKKAIENGKYVVTANKDLMATHGEELIELARRNNVNIYYEASVGGGIPLIRPMKQSLVADRVRRLIGIVNGTTNYIFTRMARNNMTLQEALAEAQKFGFAEPDPTNDVEGLDAAYKLVIMANLVFGKKAEFAKVHIEGISGVTYEDIAYAREIGYTIKLLAIGEEKPGGLALRVHPTLVSLDHPLASVMNELNAVFIESDAAHELMFYGPGAGPMPTATAILSDVVEAARSIRFNVAGGVMETKLHETSFVPLGEVEARFYLRFLVEDRAGVFASLANAFGDENVSLDMIIQKRRVGELAEVVLVTHKAKEEAFRRALSKVTGIEAIKSDPSIIRLLD
ncbi:MAG: homoserine dehydrogenase [Bacillota bacterium]